MSALGEAYWNLRIAVTGTYIWLMRAPGIREKKSSSGATTYLSFWRIYAGCRTATGLFFRAVRCLMIKRVTSHASIWRQNEQHGSQTLKNIGSDKLASHPTDGGSRLNAPHQAMRKRLTSGSSEQMEKICGCWSQTAGNPRGAVALATTRNNSRSYFNPSQAQVPRDECSEINFRSARAFDISTTVPS